ncbi:NAD(P)-binding domain-containing protein [candidate division KSB1 bacterium]|nr:NAD(P)-binding domain-containing protein [candidate division KSB1 bacterium]
MKIGIIGSGVVGQTLGSGFNSLGHSVKIGTRDPQKLQDWVKTNRPNASAGSFAETASFGDVIVVAVSWSGCENALKLADPKNFAGKVVIDATNPLKFTEQGKPPQLALGHTDSAGEQVQRWLPDAHVVKAFNIAGNAHMVHPDFPDGPPDMFICGNDNKAKQTVTEFLEAFGWPVIDLGDITKSRYLEPLAMIWVEYLFRNGFNPNHAFRLLRK